MIGLWPVNIKPLWQFNYICSKKYVPKLTLIQNMSSRIGSKEKEMISDATYIEMLKNCSKWNSRIMGGRTRSQTAVYDQQTGIVHRFLLKMMKLYKIECFKANRTFVSASFGAKSCAKSYAGFHICFSKKNKNQSRFMSILQLSGLNPKTFHRQALNATIS